MDERIKLEIKRQTAHALGILIILPIIFLKINTAIQIIAVLVAAFLFAHWYYSKRKARRRVLKSLVGEFDLLTEKQKEQLMHSAKKFEEYEESIINQYLNHVRRAGERKPALVAVTFFLAALLTLIFFGREIAVIAIITLAIGDSVSTVFGKAYGRHKWFFDKKKSLEGSLAFFIFVFLALLGLFYFLPSFALINYIWLAFLAALVGAAVEALPTINDNLAVPIVTGLAIYLITLI